MDRKIRKPGAFSKTYKKLSNKLPELVLQSLLLLLGVVLALAIGNWDEDRKRDKEVMAILENLQSEVLKNVIVIQVWSEYLEELEAGIDSVFYGQKPMESVLTNEGIMLEELVHLEQPSSLLQETAWKTAQASNLLQHLDYRILFGLTEMYNYQNNTIQKEYLVLSSLFLDRESFQPDLAKTNLQMIRRLAKELKVHHENINKTYTKIFHEMGESLPKEE